MLENAKDVQVVPTSYDNQSLFVIWMPGDGRYCPLVSVQLPTKVAVELKAMVNEKRVGRSLTPVYSHPTIAVDLTSVVDYTVLVNFGKVKDDHTPISLVVASVLGVLGEEVREIDLDGVMLTVRVNKRPSDELVAELCDAVEELGCTPENF